MSKTDMIIKITASLHYQCEAQLNCNIWEEHIFSQQCLP